MIPGGAGSGELGGVVIFVVVVVAAVPFAAAVCGEVVVSCVVVDGGGEVLCDSSVPLLLLLLLLLMLLLLLCVLCVDAVLPFALSVAGAEVLLESALAAVATTELLGAEEVAVVAPVTSAAAVGTRSAPSSTAKRWDCGCGFSRQRWKQFAMGWQYMTGGCSTHNHHHQQQDE